MADELVELVIAGYRAWNDGDRSWVLEHMTPDVEWVSAPDDPDGRDYHGHESVQRFWDQWRAAVGQLRFELIEIGQYGDEVVVRARRQGKGAHSGLEVADEVTQVFSFDPEGRCFRVREFYDREQAISGLQVHGGEGWQDPN